MKYYIIAGEASGDLHASNLIKAIKQLDNTADVRGWGGDRMAYQGANVVKHYRELAFMGFVEVIRNISTIMSNLKFCKKDILSFDPDVVILIDYPGFNMEVAKFLKKKSIKTVYYISPQVWAWKKNRVYKIKKLVDKLLVILPFEKDFYKKYSVDAEFVGHPLLDEIKASEVDMDKSDNVNKTVALLPGSRKQEIAKMLPIMLSVIDHFPKVNFVVAAVSSIEEEFYRNYLKYANVSLVFNDTYNLLRKSQAAIVTSGTATLETAIVGIPEVVCYKANVVSYYIARFLIKVRFISLVNLIMDKLVVKELIQHDLNTEMLRTELDKLLYNSAYITRITSDYGELRKKLGGTGASLRAAQSINQLLINKQ